MNKLLLLCVFILAACDPYAGLTTPTPTATATGTATAAPKSQLVTLTPAPATCTVTTGIDAGKLNLRSGAGVEYSVITVLHEGQSLNITPALVRGAWLKVKAGNVTGYINSKYCTTKETIRHERK